MLGLLAGLELRAQSTLQAQLEVNLGPIAIDAYNGTSANNSGLVASGPNVPACSYSGPGSNYRTCMQAVLGAYSQQGVTGVRIYFGMNGDGVNDPNADGGSQSTPFIDSSGTPNPAWFQNLSLFFQDLRAANIRYVSLTPAWGTFSPGRMTIYACISGSQGSYRYDFTCMSANANAVFYPWLPWALTYAPANTPANPGPFAAQGGPFDQVGMNDYNDVPQLTFTAGQSQPWQWSSSANSGSPLFNFFDGIFAAVANAQLQVREVDLFPEIPMYLSSLYGRLVFDNVQYVAPLDVINQIMQSHQLSQTATISTAAFQPRYGKACTTQASEGSELVLNAYLLLSAMTTGVFGSVPFSNNGTADPGDVCGPVSPTDFGYGLSVSVRNVIDVHTYPADAILDPGWGWISDPNVSGCQYYPDDGAPVDNVPTSNFSGYVQNCSSDIDSGNPSGSSQSAANMIYNTISAFVAEWQPNQIPSNATVIIGETDAYNPGGTGRDGINFPSTTEGSGCTTYGPYGSILNDSYTDPGKGVTHGVNFWCTPDWKWHRPWSTASAGENTAGFVSSGLNHAGVVLRPWAPVSWGTVLSPAPLSGNASLPYNVGACQYSPVTGPLVIPAQATSWGYSAGASPSNCWWSTGPTPTPGPSLAFPTWFALTSPVWQQGQGTVTANTAVNTTGAPRSFQLIIAGTSVTVTQNSVLAPTPLTPANGATGVSLSPTLTWAQSSGATGYIVYYGTSLNNLTQAALSGLSSTSYALGPLLPGTTYYWEVVATNSLGNSSSSAMSFTTAGQASSTALDFYPVTPCRIADTRATAGFSGMFGPPSLLAGQTRTFPVLSSSCGIPATAVAYSLNVTVVPQGYLGLLSTWPTGQPMPNVSTLNSYDGRIVANAAIVPAGTSGAINVYVPQVTDLLLDVNGYFAAPLSSGLEFYTVTPCRIADTRAAAGFSGTFGPPSMAAGQTRTFSVPSSSCGIPAASAYSLNFTVVPPAPVGNLTTWPTGQPMPNVSTLNDSNGTVVANAAIVPAGANGAINVYVTNTTDMLFDVNGYFAPGSGLHFYPVTPCRVADTRSGAGFSGMFGPPSMTAGQTRTFPIPTGSYGIPATAAAYSLNFTVVPAGALGNLTTWPTGQSMPNVSTLNDSTGTVLANAAIVPAGTNGAINVYVTNATDVLFDIVGYFAP